MEGASDLKPTDFLGDSPTFQIGYADWGEDYKGLIDDVVVYDIAPDAAVTGDVSDDQLTLSTPAPEAGYTVTWESDNNEVIDASTGKITPAAKNTDVTLTATITFGGDSTYKNTLTKEYTITVEGTGTKAEHEDAEFEDETGTYEQVFDASSITTNVKDYNIQADEQHILPGWGSTWNGKTDDATAQTQMNASFITDGSKQWFQFYEPKITDETGFVDVYTPGYGTAEDWFAIDFIMSTSEHLGAHDVLLLDNDKKAFF